MSDHSMMNEVNIDYTPFAGIHFSFASSDDKSQFMFRHPSILSPATIASLFVFFSRQETT